jgi:hypothetical protein
MQLGQAVIEMSGSPPAAFTPGRTVGAKGGPGRRQGIAVQNTSLTLDAVVSSSVATQITASQTPQRVEAETETYRSHPSSLVVAH